MKHHNLHSKVVLLISNHTNNSSTIIFSLNITIVWLFSLVSFNCFVKCFYVWKAFKQQFDKSVRVWLFWWYLGRNVEENPVIIRNHVGNTITIISNWTETSSRGNLWTHHIWHWHSLHFELDLILLSTPFSHRWISNFQLKYKKYISF